MHERTRISIRNDLGDGRDRCRMVGHRAAGGGTRVRHPAGAGHAAHARPVPGGCGGGSEHHDPAGRHVRPQRAEPIPRAGRLGVRDRATAQRGRFELGIGGGRPAADRSAALGGVFGTPADRLRRVADTIRAVRATKTPPRILVAASKPKMLALAAELADTIALDLPPRRRGRLAATVEGSRAAPLDELDYLNVVAVARRRTSGLSVAHRQRDRGDRGRIAFRSRQHVDQLLRRYGISYSR